MTDLSRRTLIVAGLAAAACTSTTEAGGPALPVPSVAGPIRETATSRSYRSAGGDDAALVASYGYSREEYFIEGATSLGSYRTRIVLTRPREARKFSGVFIAETFQTSIWLQVRDFLMREGHGWIMISSRGNQWLPMLQGGSPGRYDAFSLPPDEINAELMVQVVAMLRSQKAPNPAADLKVRKIVLAGYSGDGASTRMFIERAHNSVRLANGKPVFDGYFVCATAVGSAPNPIADIDVPVLELMNENEMIRSFERGAGKLAYRREDGPLYRLWEIAGAGHITTRNLTPALETTYAAACVELPHSDIAMDHIYSNALHRLIQWIERGTAPAHADRISYEADGRTILRDGGGNTIGGVRSTALDVPRASYRVVSQVKAGGPSVRCEMVAHMTRFSADRLAELYGSPDGYAKKVAQRADELVRAGFYLPHDAEMIKTEAAKVGW